jgi:hypothetical protein
LSINTPPGAKYYLKNQTKRKANFKIKIDMHVLYIIGGVVLFLYGIWQTIRTVKVFLAGKQDWLGLTLKYWRPVLCLL